jgi:hypothetical protein
MCEFRASNVAAGSMREPAFWRVPSISEPSSLLTFLFASCAVMSVIAELAHAKVPREWKSVPQGGGVWATAFSEGLVKVAQQQERLLFGRYALVLSTSPKCSQERQVDVTCRCMEC